MTRPIPSQIELHKSSGDLSVGFAGKELVRFSGEFLRVHSPSAEVRGHGNPVLQVGKQHVRVTSLEPVGNYGIKLIFSDGHDSGIYNWAYLAELHQNKEQMWDLYLKQLEQAGASRQPLFHSAGE